MKSGLVVAGAVGTALTGIGLWIDPRRVLFAYLAALTYFLTVTAGVLALMMILQVTGAGWRNGIRPVMLAIVKTLPIQALLWMPLLFGIEALYPWAASQDGRHVRVYLNVPFFAGRAAFYFACWIVLAFLASRPKEQERPVASALGLPILGLTLTFASFDWLMSMTPTWSSSAYGIYVLVGSLVAAIAAVVVLAEKSAMPTYALGRLLFALLVFWAYIAFAQGFLIYMANKPAEAPWYQTRLQNGWEWVTALLVAGHFALPFVVLLSRAAKEHPRTLAVSSGWLLIMHYVDIYWLVMPVHDTSMHWLDASALLCVGGITGASIAVLRSRYYAWA